jgi:hypothetical protein
MIVNYDIIMLDGGHCLLSDAYLLSGVLVAGFILISMVASIQTVDFYNFSLRLVTAVVVGPQDLLKTNPLR